MSARRIDERALTQLQELPSIPGLEFHGADLRGADLAGLRVTTSSLRGIDLSGANLAGARFTTVDLTGATLDGAVLRDTRFELVNAAGASMRAVDAAGAHWSLVDLTRAELAEARLGAAALHGCTLEGANLEGANLSDAQLFGCRCSGASFRGATLDLALSGGSTFPEADFTDAREFAWSREIIVEILRAEIGDDFDAARFVGAIAVGHRWCYEDWRRILDPHPHYLRLALEIFGRYPHSGIGEALERGLAAGSRADARP